MRTSAEIFVARAERGNELEQEGRPEYAGCIVVLVQFSIPFIRTPLAISQTAKTISCSAIGRSKNPFPACSRPCRLVSPAVSFASTSLLLPAYATHAHTADEQSEWDETEKAHGHHGHEIFHGETYRGDERLNDEEDQ